LSRKAFGQFVGREKTPHTRFGYQLVGREEAFHTHSGDRGDRPAVKETIYQRRFDDRLVVAEDAFHTPIDLSETKPGSLVELKIWIDAGDFVEWGIQIEFDQ
jgi:hypothetical protein